MPRYINADKVLDDIKDLDETEFADGTIFREDAIWFIKNAPTADVQEVKHGHWVFNKDDACFTDGGLYCNLCGKYGVRDSTGRWNKTNYCPYCGAKMDMK